MACGIYKITNLINGKVYIGQSKDIEERWKSHIYNYNKKDYYGYHYPLYEAIRKYRLENFKFEILEECLLKDLNKKEQYYIKFFNCYSYNGNGYNQDFKNIERVLKCSRLDEIQLKQIIELLKNSNILFKDIAKKFNCSLQTITNINRGTAYHTSNLNYPIRQKQIIIKYCPICGKQIYKDSTYCKDHLGMLTTIGVPSKEEILKAFYELKNCQKVADKFNVSTVLLKKWRKELDLPEKVKDIIKLYEREYLGVIKEEKIKNPNWMAPIKQMDKDTKEIIQIFENPIQAAKHIQEKYQSNNKLNNIITCIYNCLKGQIKTACGFKWEYLKN